MPADNGTATAADRFRAEQRVELDLRTPPSREEAGLADGSGTLIIERESERMLDVSLTLPNGAVLEVPAFGVVLSTSVDAAPDGPVESITVNRRVDDLATARAALVANAPTLALDAAEVGAFFDGVQPGPRETRVFASAGVGYLRIDVEVRHDPLNGEHVTIDYKLDWGSAAGSGA
ncbi:MAG TPA: hypothetical protein VGX28_08840 [Frankiaceae bacterium]|jgi:hypothetical protein|nr:hypothetical protein [Frankiaceae bacterium]